MPQTFLQLVKTRIFYEFLKIVKSALFQNTTEQQNRLKKSGYSAICDVIPGLFRTVFASIARKKMPDKCVVFGCNNRPNKGNGIFLHPISFDGTDDRKMWVDLSVLVSRCSLGTHEIFGGVFGTLP